MSGIGKGEDLIIFVIRVSKFLLVWFWQCPGEVWAAKGTVYNLSFWNGATGRSNFYLLGGFVPLWPEGIR